MATTVSEKDIIYNVLIETKNSGQKIQNLDKSVKKVDTSMTDFKNTIGQVGAALGIAFGTQQVIQFTKEAVKLAAEVQGIQRAFDAINQPGLLSDLRKAVNGTVNDIELMRSAVQAKNFKIPLQNLAKFFEFAASRARDTGQSVDFLVESIIGGIGRKSALVLDNVGISATEISAEFKKTGDFAQAAANIIERDMAAAGESVATAKDTFEQLNVAITNAQLRIGQRLLPEIEKLSQLVTGLGSEGGATIIDTLLIPFKALGDIFLRIISPLVEFGRAIGDLIGRFGQAKEEGTSFVDVMDGLVTVMKIFLAPIILVADGLTFLIKKMREFEDQNETFNAALKATGDFARGAIKWVRDLFGQDTQDDLSETAKKMAGVSHSMVLFGQSTGNAAIAAGDFKLTLKDMQAEVDRLKVLLDDAEVGSEEFTRLNNLIIAIEANMARLRGEAEETKTAFQRLAEEVKLLNDQLLDQALLGKLDTSSLDLLVQKVLQLAAAEEKLANAIELATPDNERFKTESNERIDQQRAEQATTTETTEINTAAFLGLATQQDLVRALTRETFAELGTGVAILGDQFANLFKEGSELQRQFVLASILADTARAIAGAVAASQNIPFPGNIAAVATSISVVLANIARAKQLFAESEAVGFAEGEIDIHRRGETRGKDSINAMLMPGESVIRAKETRENKPLLEALHSGRLDEFINQAYISPAVMSLLRTDSFDENLAKSLKYNDYQLRLQVGKNKTVNLSPDSIRQLATQMRVKNRVH